MTEFETVPALGKADSTTTTVAGTVHQATPRAAVSGCTAWCRAPDFSQKGALSGTGNIRTCPQNPPAWHAADVFEKSVPATRPAQSPPAIHGGDSDAVAPPLVVPRRLPYVAATHSRC